MEEKKKNKNYHTVLPYTKLHEENEAAYEAYKVLSPEEKKEKYKGSRPSFLNYFKKIETVTTCTEYYHDIVMDNGRPDYKTIEVLLLKDWVGDSDKKGFTIYNGYKVKLLDNGQWICIEFLLDLGSNLDSHLLSFFVVNAYQEKFPSIKSSYIKLQEFFNETEENIRHALISLQNLNLITFSEENNGDLIINLNKDNILKIEEKYSNYSYLEKDIVINKHYNEQINKIPICPHCSKELSIEDIELLTEGIEDYI